MCQERIMLIPGFIDLVEIINTRAGGKIDDEIGGFVLAGFE